ncbi:MAG: Uma2 family endonuclease [Armatimonadetes bacterium]|nr:Uma2 family endonuclease [Armatimonadota bacterium]
MALEHAAVERDLLYESKPMENQVHGTLSWDDLVLPLRTWQRRTGWSAFIGCNSPVAYERGVDALGPDVYVVNGGVDRGQEGWVPWREGGLTPTLVIEMLSPSTEAEDRGRKMRIYRDVLKVVDYFLFQSETGGVEYYRLRNGVYVRTHSNRRGQFRCASLPMLLGVVDRRLRWFGKDGHMLPSTSELEAETARERECSARERARAQAAEAQASEALRQVNDVQSELKEARATAARLLAKLRDLGVDEH